MVKIITDTTSCLPKEFAQKHQIPVIPQIVTFGEDSFYEGIELDNAGFMQRLKTSTELPKTAAPPPELFAVEFKRFSSTGEAILCIHPSSEVSGTVRSATVAATDFPEMDIRIIDTRMIASPLATLVQLAAEWAESGLDADTIEKRIMEMLPRCRVYFLVATLEYLAKGGRIGGASALLGSILQVKPILYLHDGKVDVYEKERTHKRALERMKEIVYTELGNETDGYLTVMHAGVPEQGQALANELGAALALKHVPIFDVPPAIVTHGGPGILGVAFYTGG